MIQWKCLRCGRAASYPSGAFEVMLEGGSGFPDFLGCGAYPFLIVSERVITALRAAGVTFQQHGVSVKSIRDSQLQLADAPTYFRIEATGQCWINLAASGIQIQGICEECGELQTRPPLIRRFTLLEGSWDGSDLCHDPRYFSRVYFASQRIADLSSNLKFTNCRLTEMGQVLAGE
jgi:hypothetical protein